jgi:hypothetical protein
MKIYLINKLKAQYTIYLIAAMCILSCSNPSNQPEPAKKNKGTVRIKPPSSFSDTIIVTIPSAIFFKPDTPQLEKIKAITDSLIFESMQHDCFYQMRNSRILLATNYPKIKIIEVVNASHILFKMAKGEIKIIDLNSNNDPCGIYLFQPDKEPLPSDMTNIDSELGFYFHR